MKYPMKAPKRPAELSEYSGAVRHERARVWRITGTRRGDRAVWLERPILAGRVVAIPAHMEGYFWKPHGPLVPGDPSQRVARLPIVLDPKSPRGVYRAAKKAYRLDARGLA